MKNEIYPCLCFDGQAKEAAAFYCSVFKNSKTISENPVVSYFEIMGRKFMTLNAGPDFKMTPSISAFVNFETTEETHAAWNKLIEGGKAMIQIGKQAWSECYGWLEDKYGFTWQLSVVNNPGDKPSIKPAMLFTGKLFGKAEEAVKFYASVFENSSIPVLMHYPETDPSAGKILFSQANLDENPLIAMDGPGTHNFTFTEGVSLVVNCKTQFEIDYFWKKLSDGGEEGVCGWLKDKFGISWQIVPEITAKLMSDPEKSKRVMNEVMKMKKLDLEKMVNA
jgi:predicted 3-demethylubiquinone-9 3-methyltransferase (glyoxalase superfamily)